MRVTTLTLLTVLCSGLTTVAVGQRDDFDRPNRRPANSLEPAMPFAGNIPFDSEPLAPTNFVVHTPSGEPAGLAQVEVYRGDMVNIHIAGDASSEIKITQADHFLPSQQQERRSIPVNDDGTFETPVTSPTKFVIVHESGYAIHAPTAKGFQESNGKKIIKLQPWSQASGKITLNNKPPAGHRVTGRWESFPFSPAMLNLDANERVHGPPLVSITQTVDIGENGEYTFTKLPPGRLRLKLAAPEKEGENDTDPEVAGNVQWWQSAVAKKAGPNPFPQDAPPENVFDFSVITVKGRIKLTDEIFERRVTVNRTANGVEAGQAELMVSFFSPVNQVGEDWLAKRTLEQAVRAAVVWGRPGGQREKPPVGVITGNVDRKGAFKYVLTNGEYNVSLVMSKQMEVGDEGRVVTVFENLATDIAKVPKQPADFDTANSVAFDTPNRLVDNVVDLGEIEVHLQDKSRGSFIDLDDERTRSDSRDAVDRDRLKNDDGDRRPPLRDDDPPSVRSDDGFGRNPRRNDDPRDEVLDWAPRGRLPPQRNVHPQVLDEPRPAAASPSPTAAPVDQAIAKLVTDLLAAGDRRTRENMRTPLKELLQQKFDAEQKAREALLTQLRKRLEEASQQVTERKQKKDQIVTQQLDRMMSLPEDRFLPMDAINPPVDTTPYNPNDFYPPDDTRMRSELDDDRLDDARLERPSNDRLRASEPRPIDREKKAPPVEALDSN